MDNLEKTIKDIDSIGRSKDAKVELVKQGCDICFASNNKTDGTTKDKTKKLGGINGTNTIEE